MRADLKFGFLSAPYPCTHKLKTHSVTELHDQHDDFANSLLKLVLYFLVHIFVSTDQKLNHPLRLTVLCLICWMLLTI